MTITLGLRQVIFARCTSQQKLLIVENAQRLGHIVGVVGVNVDDAAALKKGDAGISFKKMGHPVGSQPDGGSDVIGKLL